MTQFDDKTVYILDSYGLIYRCYFAFISRPLTNQSGQNISAVFGFFRNLHALLVHYKPAYLIAAFDSRTPTFRHKMYADYKATRQKTPEDLHAQVPWIEDILIKLGIPVLRSDGYEADDVIATIAAQCSKQGRPCRILSGDKDLMQLVNDTTQILKPDKGEVWKVVGAEGVKADWGVEPERMQDLLSLIGDTADNIPGVKGVGPKTACKYLDQYGTLDDLFAHADEIKGSIGEKIRAGKQDAYFSKDLIKLCTTVPYENSTEIISIDNIQPVTLDYKGAADLLKQYGTPAVAKQYAEMALGSNNDTTTTDSIAQKQTYDLTSQNSIEPLKPLSKNTGNYHAVTDIQELTSIIDTIIHKTKLCAFDTETDSLNTREAHLVGFSISTEAGSGVYIPLILTDALFAGPLITQTQALEQLSRLFSTPEVTVVMHNGKFDYEVLRTAGISFTPSDSLFADTTYPQPLCTIADTMIAAWLLEPDKQGKTPYSLEYLAESKLALAGTEYNDIVQKNQTFADVSIDTAANYAAEDADFTLQLWYLFKPQLDQKKLYALFTDTEMKILPILAEMELRGIHLDSEALATYNAELLNNIETTKQDIYQLVGHEFNIASTKQLQEVLFTERKLTPGKKTKTGYSTDTAVLEELAAWDPVPKKILEYRELAKLQSTYVEALPKLCDIDSRIHTSFMQTGTATGRLSSRDPNLQNIPIRNDAGRRIRTAFTAVPGTVLISADYSQIELVVLAHLSADPNMCKAFSDGVDVHKATASMIFSVPTEQVTADMRRTAKTINFGVIYGMSAFRLSNELGIPRAQAASFIESYFKTYASIQNFISETVSQAESRGYVETIFGRKRPIMNINSRNKLEKTAAERIAVNTPVQGSAADIVKKAMLDVDTALRKQNNGAHLLLQVHDELILECPDKPEIIQQTVSLVQSCMEHAVQLRIPLRVSVEYGKNWGEFH
ncbi:MAG: DNA polymerase I [Treponema sp.]|nr:DNA polymerase I [Treponema sp.]